MKYSEAYVAMNPNSKVSTLVDGAIDVWESHAILRYLAAEYGQKSDWPKGPAARSRIDRWMDWSQAQFDSSCRPRRIGGPVSTAPASARLCHA
jgi:glutathione S-transferase